MLYLSNSALQGRLGDCTCKITVLKRGFCRACKSMSFLPDQAKARTCLVRACGFARERARLPCVTRAVSEAEGGIVLVPARFREGCTGCISIPPARRSRATSLCTREALVSKVQKRPAAGCSRTFLRYFNSSKVGMAGMAPLREQVTEAARLAKVRISSNS